MSTTWRGRQEGSPWPSVALGDNQCLIGCHQGQGTVLNNVAYGTFVLQVGVNWLHEMLRIVETR